jgi:hypothetical protein
VLFSEPVDASESRVEVTSQEGKNIHIAVSWKTDQAEIAFLDPLTPQITYTVTFLNLLDIAAFRTPKTQFTFTTTNSEIDTPRNFSVLRDALERVAAFWAPTYVQRVVDVCNFHGIP